MSNVPLPSLSRDLKDLGYRKVPSYRVLWTKVVNGDLPVEKVNGRYFADPLAVAKALGLTIQVAA